METFGLNDCLNSFYRITRKLQAQGETSNTDLLKLYHDLDSFTERHNNEAADNDTNRQRQ